MKKTRRDWFLRVRCGLRRGWDETNRGGLVEMRQQRMALVGRDAELAVLQGADRRRAMLVVRGPAGSGKTSVLARSSQELAGNGFVTVEVPGSAEHPEWDLFGICAVLRAVCEGFEEIGGGPRATEALAAARRLCTEDNYASSSGKYRLIHAFSALFRVLGARKPVALLVDDTHLIAQPAVALAALRPAGQLVIASCRGEAGELCAAADQVVDLGPLQQPDADLLLKQVAGTAIDGALRDALRRDLGRWYLNPGTLTAAVADLHLRDRLTTVHGHLCLRDVAEPIALPPGHPLCAEVDSGGPAARDLVLLASAGPRFGVDEIPVLAAAAGRSPIEYGRTADRLVLAEVLDADPAARLTVGCPALGAAVAAADPDRLARLRRTVDEQVADPAVNDVRPVSSADIPLDPAWQKYAVWQRARPGPESDRLAGEIVRSLVRAGAYARLADFAAEAACRAGSTAACLDGIAAAAMLASVHLGQPVPAAVEAALDGSDAAEFGRRWFAGAVVRVADVESAFAPLRQWCLPNDRLHRQPLGSVLDAALAMRDLVPALESVLGPGYQAAPDGPIAAVHRVCAGYAGEDWTDALSAARRLETDPDADQLSRQATRLLAAEMCNWRGEDRLAASWLVGVPEDGAVFAALRGWVLAGIRQHSGDVAGAFEIGWSAFLRGRDREETLGVSLLLRRLAAIAAESGRPADARRVLAEAQAWHGGFGTVESTKTVLVVRGLVEDDGTHARAAERVIRRHGNRFELSLACQRVAETSDEPHVWLNEAYEIARAIGAARLTARARQSLRCHGVVVSMARPSPAREQLSETELRIIELIRSGRTNRQIALELRMSEKTVEKHLTRLFAKAGCRTRHGLATSGLGGWLEQVGA
ncbi:LuxR C-terminal-related transcriptional regulator [Amycolatopsis sp. NPDC059090]|uniref:LuxR C-terminal-related transcriptional regulator n=1 Tax=unclassified Amycolatopsis TaxID=2618356 RepID=UPI00366F31F9